MPSFRTNFASLLIFIFVFLGLMPTAAKAQLRRGPEVEKRITELIAKMTLAEKLGQLQQLDGEANGKYRPEHIEMARKGLLGSTLNVRGAKMTNELQRAAMESRLKIPILFGFDVIHGYRTVFPVPLGESASWDLALMEKTASIAAAESKAAGVHWTFAPMVDVARDPRWGRIIEGAGEDTFLGSKIAFARVRGFQGDDYSAKNRVLATAKHWVGYGAAEAGRDYATTDLTERALREIYFPPFKAAIDAGVDSFMTSFNDLDGVPATANPFVLKKVLRDEWGFDGLVVSDYTAVMELMFHGLAKDEADAAALSLNAGTDMEMVSRLYVKNGEELVKSGRVTMETIDGAVRHVLRIKYRLGLFDDPYADEVLEKREVFKPAYRETAKLAAERSFVLLKNEHETLPIAGSTRSIAIIGALANSKPDMNANWTGDGRPEDPVTVLEALKTKYPQMAVTFEPGCNAKCESDEGFAKAVQAAKNAEFTILVVGESGDMSAEASSRSNIDLPGKQLELVKAVHAAGKPYAVVLMNGRPLTIGWVAENSPAILETWFGGTMAGPAVVDTLFGDSNPGGKLPVTFPRSVGQIPIYYNQKRTGRPFKETEKYTSKYLDIPNTPQYPFGFGLSYTKFKLSGLKLDRRQMLPDGSVKVSVDVENTGKREGDEVVQLYIQDVAASVTRPVKELRGFERITLKAGEKRTVVFMLTAKELSFLGRDLKPVLEPGEFTVFVGNSSDSGLQDTFEVVTQLRSAAVKPLTDDAGPAPAAASPTAAISKEDDEFLEDLSHRSFRYLWEHSDPQTGITLDRVGTDGKTRPPGDSHYDVGTIAATGFALTSYCIAADRKWITPEQARERTKNTLDFFANKIEHQNGWFYHFIDYKTGERRWRSELSSIDTALLLGGVLSVRGCFADDKNITRLATKIYERVDFDWMLNGDANLLSHGWRPETGWIKNRWDDYSEQMVLYLLAIGSPSKPIPPQAWYAWQRKWVEYEGYRYLSAVSPLFIHQFSHAFVDFRNRRERKPPYVDYFDNSVKATLAQRSYMANELSKDFPKYGANMWGLTASDSAKGYIAWGAPPREPAIDGTVVPCAAAGSLMFTPQESLAALKNMKALYGKEIYGKYGFADAFNPQNGWVNKEVIGIDIGITLLSAENLRSGKVWFWFMQSPEIRRAMNAISLN